MPTTPAVFLSYASQDAEAARRNCEALRAAEIEVWFDQNELVGGDAWDAKIRKQIKECALFVPVISENTNARAEGYFRLEWLLAVERSRLMAHDQPFLLPVVIDGTADAAARVPERFRDVQWTRLPAGETVPTFVLHAQRLLNAETAPASGPTPAQLSGSKSAPPKPGPTFPWAGGAAVAAIVVAVVAFLLARSPAPTRPTPPATTAATAAVPPAGPSLGPKSIAVLPFDNFSDDKDASAFFADGMHEQVISNLHLIRELRCVPRTTAMAFRDSKKTSRAIAEELGVAYLLSGTVRRANNKVRITATLLNPRTDETLWVKPYDKDLTDVFGIQSELAQAIAAELKAAISPQEQKLVQRRPTDNTAAYDAFLKARELRHGGMSAAWFRERARNLGSSPEKEFLADQEALLQSAVTLDRNFALAWAELAWIHGSTYYGYEATYRDRTESRRRQAREAIATAVRLAPDVPEVILNQGWIHLFCDHSYEQAAAEFAKFNQLQPDSPAGLLALATLHCHLAHWTEALACYRRIVELDPSDAAANGRLTDLLLAGRRYDEYARELQRWSQALSPRNYAMRTARLSFFISGSTNATDEWLGKIDFTQPQNRNALGRLATLHGGYVDRFFEAVGNQGIVASPEDSWVTELHWATIEAARGNTGKARSILATAPARLRARLVLEPSNTTLLGDLACTLALLGEKDEALRTIRTAIDLVPRSSNAWQAPHVEENLAYVYAWTGDKDNAIATYARLLQTPCVSPRSVVFNVHVMRHSLWYSPLRGDARWEALLNDPKNNAPLF